MPIGSCEGVQHAKPAPHAISAGLQCWECGRALIGPLFISLTRIAPAILVSVLFVIDPQSLHTQPGDISSFQTSIRRSQIVLRGDAIRLEDRFVL